MISSRSLEVRITNLSEFFKVFHSERVGPKEKLCVNF